MELIISNNGQAAALDTPSVETPDLVYAFGLMATGVPDSDGRVAVRITFPGGRVVSGRTSMAILLTAAATCLAAAFPAEAT